MKKYFCSKHFFVPLILITLYSCGLLFFSLLNSFSFEYNFFLTIPVSLISAYTAIAFSKVTEDRSTTKILLINSLLLTIPLAIISFHDLFTVVCNYWYGLILFFLLPVVSMLFATGVASLISLLRMRILLGYLVFVAILILSFMYSMYLLLTQPPIFMYSAFLGYFPGAIYDETITITKTLVIYRLLILALGIICILFYILKKSTPFHKIRASILAIFFIAAGYTLFHGDSIGFSTSWNYLEKTLGKKHRTPHFEIIYDQRLSEQAIQLIINDHEQFYEQLKKTLHTEPKLPIHSYIYKDGKQKKRLMGAQDVLIGDFNKRVMHLNFQEPPIESLKHELAHIFSSAFMGGVIQTSLNIGIAEGFATAMDPSWGKLTLHQWAKALYELKMDLPLETLFHSWGFWKYQSSKSYLSMGSFCAFLIDTYGIEKFKLFYSTLEFESTYGFPLSQAINEWKTFLTTIAISKDEIAYAKNTFIHKGIFEKVCPHEVAYLEDKGWELYQKENYQNAYSSFESAYEKSHHYPLLLHNMIRTKFSLKAYDVVIKLSEKLIALDVSKYSHDFAELYIIRSLIETGRNEEARKRMEGMSISPLDTLYNQFKSTQETFKN